MVRHRVIRFAELDSTNRHALANLTELADGDVIQADIQTAGHGRMNRPWVSHLPGNLCLTLVIKPRHAAPASLPLANLSQLLALTVCRMLDGHGARATLKWPNDVLLDGRKIAGLLAETVVQGHTFGGMALGLGVNLNLDAATLATVSQPATSLSEWTGSPVDADAFRDALLEMFFRERDALLEHGFGLIRDEYLARCGFLGREVEIRRGTESLRGIAEDVDLEGALMIRTAPDRIEPVAIGEMFLGS
ncbi:MAG: biotin--[acetyl-CoA-carboxylase] ligase [Verrucomicrobia bacterium]|nr:biotin--[acetyl-CoA-carboxylase] ligase [Verrucomicrobiota bacterium]